MTIPGGDYAIEDRLGKHRRSFGTLLLDNVNMRCDRFQETCLCLNQDIHKLLHKMLRIGDIVQRTIVASCIGVSVSRP